MHYQPGAEPWPVECEDPEGKSGADAQADAGGAFEASGVNHLPEGLVAGHVGQLSLGGRVVVDVVVLFGDDAVQDAAALIRRVISKALRRD